MTKLLILVVLASIVSGIILHLLFTSGILNKPRVEAKKLVNNIEEVTEQQITRVKV